MEKSREAFRTISEVSEILDTPPHVLRFWESRFPQVRPVKRAGGRRYYRPTDVALLSGIKRLLHSDGLTIRGVQKVLREQGIRHVMALADDALMGEVTAEQGMPAIDPDIAPPIARVLPFPDPAAPRVASVPAMQPDPDLNAIPEMAVEPADLVDDSAVLVIEELALPDEEPDAPGDEPQEEVSLQLTELIAEFIEQAESEADEPAAAPDLPLWANAPADTPAAPAPAPEPTLAPASSSASVPAPAPAAADLGDDTTEAAEAAEAPRGAWIATELRRLTPPMAAPYSAEFSALGRRLEALRAKAAAAATPRKG